MDNVMCIPKVENFASSLAAHLVEANIKEFLALYVEEGDLAFLIEEEKGIGQMPQRRQGKVQRPHARHSATGIMRSSGSSLRQRKE